MQIRRTRRYTPVLLMLLPLAVLAADDESAIEAAGAAADEIIAYTRVLFDCEMLVESIERPRLAGMEADFWFVTLKAEGVECEQAFDVLNRRGRNRGLYFPLPKDPDDAPEPPGRMNFDLIHEIDPETDN